MTELVGDFVRGYGKTGENQKQQSKPSNWEIGQLAENRK